MKAVILYDLAAPVEMSQEDAEVVALVNRGRAPDDRLVVAYGPGIYLVPRPVESGLVAFIKNIFRRFLKCQS